MKTLDKYILKELLGPFLFGLGAFTILFFSVESMVGVARMISDANVPFSLVLEYLACRLPQVLIFTLPMATLMGCLLGVGRLSGEGELTALRASGISFLRIALPGLLLFLGISCFAYYLNDTVVPQRMKRAYNILLSSQKDNIVKRVLMTAPRRLENGMDQTLYANRFDFEERRLEGVYIHFSSDLKRKREIYAEEARWVGDRWELKKMRTVEYNEQQEPIFEATASEGWTGLQPGEAPPSPDSLKKRSLRPEEMTRSELEEALVLFEQQSDNELQNKVRKYSVMYHQKASLPWVSFIFATFAIPLGVRPHRSAASTGLGLSLLFILLFYILMTTGLLLGEAGQMDPQLGAWLPNIIFGSLGLFYLFRASQS